VTIIKHDFQRGRKNTNKAEKEEKKIPGFQLRISLSYSTPTIWRTVNLPGTLTLAGLHSVIQRCFGWQDDATYRFLVGKIFYSPDEAGSSGSSRSSTTTQLHEIEKDMTFVFSYLYDGGCGWECEITLEQLFPNTKEIAFPILVNAQQASPPAACDDIHEYQDMIATLEKATANRKKILAQKDVPLSFDPSVVDVTAINADIQNIR